jgi:hypothetical protein
MPIETTQRNRLESNLVVDKMIPVPICNQRVFLRDLQNLVELHGEYCVDDEEPQPLEAEISLE